MFSVSIKIFLIQQIKLAEFPFPHDVLVNDSIKFSKLVIGFFTHLQNPTFDSVTNICAALHLKLWVLVYKVKLECIL